VTAAPARFEIARAMREDRGRFARIRDARVLVYWPHGLGDWTHLGAILPLLEPSNAYATVRFGDDYGSVMENQAYATPLRSGVRAPGTGAELGAAHLGVELRRLNGGHATLALPAPLDGEVRAFAPDTLLWTDYPETEGRTAYPFHTKARNLARLIVRPERLAQFDLAKPLPSAIDFSVSPETQRRVDERLAAFAPPGTKLCIVSRAGVTAARKNWGDGSEARAFVVLMHRDDPRWRFISMDGEALGDGVTSYRDGFGEIDEPFARVFKAVVARAALFVGVPAGPLHVTMARGGVPVVGLWLAHHPDWYDEPNPSAIHIVGKYVRDRRFDRRVASTTKPPSLAHRIEYLDTPAVAASAALEAARHVL
jgi:hypothetical protein